MKFLDIELDKYDIKKFIDESFYEISPRFSREIGDSLKSGRS